MQNLRYLEIRKLLVKTGSIRLNCEWSLVGSLFPNSRGGKLGALVADQYYSKVAILAAFLKELNNEKGSAHISYVLTSSAADQMRLRRIGIDRSQFDVVHL